MGETLKRYGNYAFAGVAFLAFLCIPALFILGSAWAARHLLEPLATACWVATSMIVFVLLPLSIVRRFRGFTGGAIFMLSYLFGLVTWLLSFILTYDLWGLWAVIVGLLFLGGAILPFALLATLFKGMWWVFFTLIILIVVTFGARLGGAALGAQR